MQENVTTRSKHKTQGNSQIANNSEKQKTIPQVRAQVPQGENTKFESTLKHFYSPFSFNKENHFLDYNFVLPTQAKEPLKI